MLKQFTVMTEPKGKDRPRFNTKTGRTYTTSKTRKYEEEIRAAYREQVDYYFEGNLRLNVKAYYKIPKNDSKKLKQQKIDNILRPNKKPDGDNVLKAVADALNDVAYKDDVQLIEMSIQKFYSIEPRLEIEIENIK